jgi:hypothetical protein
MHPFLIRNIGPPSSMIHRHRVPLFAFQSFIGSFDALDHSCASHPLSCKCSAHPGLSSTVTALVVYRAWLCPQVRCCLIHHEGFSLLDSSENYPLIDCVHHANTHQDCQPVMNLPKVETILFKYMLSPVFMEIIQSSRHASHSLQWKTHRCILSVILNRFPSALLIRLWKEMQWHHQWCSFYHPYSCDEVRLWSPK